MTELWQECVMTTKLWHDYVERNGARYRCPGQGCTEKLELKSDTHGAHVRLKRQVKPFGKNKWEHAYVVIPTCSKCNTSYNDLTRECIAVKVADLDKQVYVGSITQGGHTVHKLENVKLVVKQSPEDVEDVEGSVGLKHLDQKQLKVLKTNLKKWLKNSELDTDHPDAISLFSEVRILFSRLMVSRGKGSDILKLRKDQKKDLLKYKAFGKHSDEMLSKDLVRHLDKKLMERCREKRGAFELSGDTPGKKTRSGKVESKRVTLNFDNDATDSFIKKLVTPPSMTPPSTPWSTKELEEWKNRSMSPKDWKERENIVLEVRGREQYPETTASDVVEHLKEILKEVVDKQTALQKVKKYCEREFEANLEGAD